MTRPAAFAMLVAGLVAVSADVQPQPKSAPLTPQQQEAMNKALGQLAGFDDNVRNAMEQLKQNPELMKQFQQNPELMKQFADQANKMRQGGDPFKMQPNLKPPTNVPRPPPDRDVPPPAFQPPPSGEPFTPPPMSKQPPNLPPGFDLSKMIKGQPQGENVPFGQDPRLANNPGLMKLIQMWEQKVGPLDQNPKLKLAVVDMLKGAGELKADGSAGGGDGFFSKLETDGGEVSSFAKWLEKTSNAPAWKMPDVDLGKMAPSAPNMGGGNWSLGGGPGVPSAPSFGGVTLPGGEAGLILLPLLLAVAGYLSWRFWPKLALGGRDDNPLSVARNRWPVDPAVVNSRAELVKAFEYISLTLCGDAARVWHHRTIAAALRARVPTADPVADELAGLYERARYTPPDEELSPSDLAAARRCLSELAGVQPA